MPQNAKRRPKIIKNDFRNAFLDKLFVSNELHKLV